MSIETILKRERPRHRVVKRAAAEGRLAAEASTPETLHVKYRGGRRIQLRAERHEAALVARPEGHHKVVVVSHDEGTIIGEQG